MSNKTLFDCFNFINFVIYGYFSDKIFFFIFNILFNLILLEINEKINEICVWTLWMTNNKDEKMKKIHW